MLDMPAVLCRELSAVLLLTLDGKALAGLVV